MLAWASHTANYMPDFEVICVSGSTQVVKAPFWGAMHSSVACLCMSMHSYAVDRFTHLQLCNM